jgi:hypothetical protein
MTRTITFFDHALKISAVVSILLFLVGYIDLKTYYGFFGINISSYLDTSEIVLASIDNLVVTIIASSIQFAFWLFFFNYLFTGDSPLIRRPKEYHNEAAARFFASKKTIVFTIVMLTTLLIATVLSTIFPNNETVLQIRVFVFASFFIYMGVFMIGVSLTNTLLNFLQKFGNYNPKVIITFLVFIPTILFTVYVKNGLMYLNIRKFGNNPKHIITFSDKKIIYETDTIIYIGRCNSYIFYWNPKKERNYIFPSSKIDEITINK